ncbi:hypothetical protein DL768_010722 [Monosporascus sp. mg162]|nr:hypothetical protein DL768_010722 [Monosporascus sp. mg162]
MLSRTAASTYEAEPKQVIPSSQVVCGKSKDLRNADYRFWEASRNDLARLVSSWSCRVGIVKPQDTHTNIGQVQTTHTSSHPPALEAIAMSVHRATEMELFHVDVEMASLLHDMSEEDLRSLAELQEDPASDKQVELYIYLCFFIFNKTRSREYLQRAAQRAEGWVAIIAADHPDRARRLQILDMMSAKMSQLSSISEDVLPLLPQFNRMLEGLPSAINRRTGRDSADDEMDFHIAKLQNSAVSLAETYERTGAVKEINEAMSIMEWATELVQEGHIRQAGVLSTLGAVYGIRFNRTGSIDDLNRAVDVTDMAVNAITQDHPDRAGWLNNLGNRLGRRFERTGSMDDLNRAVDVADMAVNAIPRDHPDRAGRLNSLGNRLGSRFERTGSMDDFNRMLTSYKEGWRCYTAPPSIRIRLARKAASILASQLNWEEASLMLQEAVYLLPNVSPRSLQHTDKQHMLSDFAGLSSTAVATALNAGKDVYHALQLLELGRGVIASLLMEMRTDISDLKQQHHGLAAEFISLRDELDSPTDRTTFLRSTDDTSSWESQAKRRRKADQKFNELILSIRAQPGFHNFLLPPNANEFRATADPDPIIIVNLSFYRCDAFLIDRDQIRLLELPGLTLEKILPFAVEEVEMLSNLCSSLKLTPITPGLRKDDVLKHLQACRIFHFAGHGRSDPTEPSRSCLLLEDWEKTPLTVGDLRDHKLQENPPFLAYLSACSTGANEAYRLADEGIPLVSAFQLAGFRHVVGTLWEVSDRHCVDVARVLYETIRDEGMTDVAVCRGLHQAVRALRDGQIEREGKERDAKFLGSGIQIRDMTTLYWIPWYSLGREVGAFTS